MARIPVTIRETIIPAIKTPKAMAKKLLQRFRFRSQAIIVPVQAPVIGKGTATNKASARMP